VVGRARNFAWAGLIGASLFLFAGCQSDPKKTKVEPIVARFYLETPPGEAGAVVQLPVSKVRIAVNPKPVFVEYDIANVEVVKVDLGWCLIFVFHADAMRDLYRLSVTAQGRRLVVAFNESVVGVRRLDQALNKEGLLIFVEVPDDSLSSLAERIHLTSAGLQARGK